MKKMLRKAFKSKHYLLMLMPTVVFFIVFSYVPMFGVIIAFKRFDYAGGVFKSPWVGFDNFKYLFISGKIYGIIRNTVLYNSAFIVINNVFQIAVAISLDTINRRIMKKAFQTFLFLPYFLNRLRN